MVDTHQIYRPMQWTWCSSGRSRCRMSGQA